MSGNDMADIELPRAQEELFKLQETVAVDAWIGRLTVFIGGDKALYHFAAKIIGKVEDEKRYAQTVRDAARVFHIVKRAAAALPLDADIFVGK